MVGVDSVFRLIGGTVALIVIIFVAGVGMTLLDPIYNNVIDPNLMQSLGWGTPQNVVMLFMTLAMIGLAIVVIIWWIVAPVRNDVRQESRPPY